MSKQQTKLINKWKQQGYHVINLITVTPIGMPDLLCLKPDKVIFIESKEKWDRLSKLQRIWLRKLTRLGFECYVNDELFKI